MIKYQKMHGNGNDFLMINSLETGFQPKKSFIKKYGERKLGIGFDQLILISPPKNENHSFDIAFYNADGGQADMCLNGIRCAARYVWEEKFHPKTVLNLNTKKGVLRCESHNKNIKVLFDEPLELKKLDIKKAIKKICKDSFTFVNAGNLHLCIKKESIQKFDLENLYFSLETLIKPHNVNLSIYNKLDSNNFEIRTYENGVGETLSCGSASASVAMLALKNKNNFVTISSKGGKLKFKKVNEQMIMIGPAKNVCSGIIND